MIRPKTTVRRTSGGPEERDPSREGPNRTQTGPGRLGTPNRDSSGKGARGEKGPRRGGLAQKVEQESSVAGREAFSRTDRNGGFLLLRPSLNHSFPPRLSPSFFHSIWPFRSPAPRSGSSPRLASPRLFFRLRPPRPRPSLRSVSVWPNARTCVRRRGTRGGPGAGQRGKTGEEDGTDLEQHGRHKSEIPKRQGKKECVGLKREQDEAVMATREQDCFVSRCIARDFARFFPSPLLFRLDFSARFLPCVRRNCRDRHRGQRGCCERL